MLTPEELHARLAKAVPALKDAPMLWRPSASSCIVNQDGDEVSGLKGQRLYIPVADASLIPEAGKALNACLWAVGEGFIQVSKAGTALLKTLVDASVWQPERLDFAGSVILKDGLSRRPAPAKFFGDQTKLFDLKFLSTDATIARQAEENKNKAKQEAREECQTVRNKWIEVNVPKLMEQRSIPMDAAKRVLQQASEKHTLNGDFILVCENGEEVTVANLLDYPDKWHNKRFADPLEPDYYNDHRIARANLRGAGTPYIWSYAHGGVRYILNRPVQQIEVGPGKRGDIVERILDFMRSRGDIYDFGSRTMARIAERKTFPVTKDWLISYFDRNLNFYGYKKASKESFVEQNTDAKDSYARIVMYRNGDRRLPKLEAVITAPIVRLDGSLLNKSGYDPASGLLYLCDEEEPPHIPEFPTIEDAKAALVRLWNNIKTFPFVDDVDRGVALAALLTACVRPVIPTAPGFAFDAPSAGTGKTLLARLCGAMMTGIDPDILPPLTEKDEEARKRLFAALYEGRQVLIWDNVRTAFGSGALDAFLTAPTFSDRVLGKSQVESFPNRALFLATGNNFRLVGDTCRRVFVSRIDARQDKPYGREFNFCPLKRTLANRQMLVADALTIIRAWHCAGKPHVASGNTASFEDWDRLVRQPLMWLCPFVADQVAFADPLDSTARAYAQDPESTKLAALLTAWWNNFQGQPMSVNAIINHVDLSNLDSSDSKESSHKLTILSDALDEVAGRSGGINSRILGRYIERNHGTRVSNLWFEDAGIYEGRKRWRVVKEANKPTKTHRTKSSGGDDVSDLA